MGNENKNEYDNKYDKSELAPLLLVPMMDEARNAKKSRGGKRFVALLLLVVAVTAAATASIGLHPIVSAFSSVLGTRRKQGQSCHGFWYDACDDGFSCFMGGNSNYCVPNGQENACCGYSAYNDEASGIDCGKDLRCDDRTGSNNHYGTVYTCHPAVDRGSKEWNVDPQEFAQKGSCNVNTGEPANVLIALHCYAGKCRHYAN